MVTKYDYLLNTKIGNYTLLSFNRGKNSILKAHCRCDCGVEKDVRIYCLLAKTTVSCGCYNRKLVTKYNYNNEAFKEINNISAYFLGLLYSDGCLVKDANEVKIHLKADREILEKLSIFVLNEIVIRDFINTHGNLSHLFYFNNKYIYKDLLKWGLYPNKSTSLTIHPDLEYNSHFWRGMIDGDGCIRVTINKEKFVYNSLVVKLCGTIEVCQSFQNYCLSLLPEYNNKIYIDKSKTNFGTYSVFGKKAEYILNELYKDSDELFLKRKKEKFNEYINYKLVKDEK